MSWSARVVRVTVAASPRVRVELMFSNGEGRSFGKVFRVRDASDANIIQIVATECVRLDAVDAALRSTALIAGAAVPVLGVETDPTPKSAEELAREAYFSDLARLRNMKAAVADGVVDANSKDYLDLQAQVKAAFLPEYL